MANSSICSEQDCATKVLARGLCSKHYQRKFRCRSPNPSEHRREWLFSAIKQETDACINWPYNLGPDGYGLLRMNNRRYSANRLVCIQVYGDPPSAVHQAAHKCGNRACVNPAHLYWATPLENSRDRLAHGTLPKGAANPKAKLTESDVLAIRAEYGAGGSSYGKLAARYGITRTQVCTIVKRKQWDFVDP